MGVHLPLERRAEHYMGMPHTAKHWTAAKVRALPHDSYRYEVIAGELVVTPAPSATHQRAVTGLLVRLANYLQHQPWAEVLASPADISFQADMLVQPDLFVLPITPDEGRVLGWSQIRTLLLAVEVLSPSTARADRQVKRRLYQHERPEIVSTSLRWHPELSTAPFELDLPEFFDDVLRRK